jgi:hypothetical protein
MYCTSGYGYLQKGAVNLLRKRLDKGRKEAGTVLYYVGRKEAEVKETGKMRKQTKKTAGKKEHKKSKGERRGMGQGGENQ